MMYLLGLVAFTLFLASGARRIIRIRDSHQHIQQSNTLTKTLELSAAGREAFLPVGFRTALSHRHGQQTGTMQASGWPWLGRLASKDDAPRRHPNIVASEAADKQDSVIEGETTALTKAEVEKIGNLVEDDEWLGLGSELFIILRSSVRESVKSKVRGFTGKDDYKVGDISKEADARIKAAVAELRGKPEYELGDLSIAVDGIVKDEVKKLTGKEEYEFGDLSKEVDKRVKSVVADFCGKDEYQAGDLSREVASRVSRRVKEFTGKSGYKFGDISREIEDRRAQWVKDFTGKNEYEFGDITKKAVTNFTGKDEYEFGDITKKLGQMFFGNKPKSEKKPPSNS